MRFEYADGRMPFVMTQSGVTYYLAFDQVESLRIITDASGNIIKRLDYDSFGSIINDTNPGFVVPFGFAGGLHDRDTGLVRFGYRDYDPEFGRWTAKDPIGFIGGDIDLYGYVQNNSINLADPLGLWSISLEGYFGLGGGIVFGRNPNGGAFVTFLFGYGVGGGLSYDPNGTSPGWDPCREHGLLNAGLGAHGGANVGLGPFYFGYNIYGGVNVENPLGYFPYFGYGPSYGLDVGLRLRFGAIVAGEVTLY